MTLPLEEILDIGGPVIPCLVGPTGAGKTERVRQLANKLDLPLSIILAGTMLPEDILGLPVPPTARSSTTTPTTRWSVPAWAAQAAQQPALLFLDELDKAAPEQWAAILTLISGRECRGLPLHSGTRIVAAMQPTPADAFLASETGKALAARCVFLSVGYDWSYLTDRYGVDLSDLPSFAPDGLPIPPHPTMRQVEWAINYARRYPETAEVVLCGMFKRDFAQELLRRLQDAVPVTTQGIIEALRRNPALIDQLSIPELVNIVGHLWTDLPTPHAYCRALVRVFTQGTEDDCSRLLERQYEHCRAAAKGADTLDVWTDIPDEDAERMLDDALRLIGINWAERHRDQWSSEVASAIEKLRAHLREAGYEV